MAKQNCNYFMYLFVKKHFIKILTFYEDDISTFYGEGLRQISFFTKVVNIKIYKIVTSKRQ